MNSRKAKRTNGVLTQAVAGRLKELRMRRNFTQEYVVENTGLNIPRVEAGKTNISLVTIGELCKFYNVTLCELFEPFK